MKNYLHELQELAEDFGPLDSFDRCGQFTELAVAFLHGYDKNFGHLKKDPGRTNYRGHGLDVSLYRATGQVIDILGAAKIASKLTPAKITWQVGHEGEYITSGPESVWLSPADVVGEPRETPTKEEPVAGPKRTYDDGRRLIAECSGALGRDVGGDLAHHLLWRFDFEGYTFEQLVAEARSRR